jgi:hypothetical protein
MNETQKPPQTIKHRGETLSLYDETPCVIRGQEWYTYSIEGDSRIWEYCPRTGQVVQSK